ncbi:MAG: hypothetical protein LBM67_02795 [Lentimicrobiaceae bacterium]|jgi:hypothetical protein|nr:hypothetical protein [Lentimicrobiaceae bacterium]
MRKRIIFACCLLLVVAVSCNNYKSKIAIKQRNPEPKSIVIKRYERALFEVDTSNFRKEIQNMQIEFLPFLGGDLNDEKNIKQLYDFVTDTFLIHLYKQTEKQFAQTKDLEKMLLPVVQHFNYYYHEIILPQIYTFVSGVSVQNPILTADNAIAIALDCYLGPDFEIYQQMGVPRYVCARLSPEFLGKDFALSLYDSFIVPQRSQTDILNEMIATGKRLFFVEAIIPDISDEILLSYTPEQLKWAQENEGKLWAFFVGEQVLYSNDYNMFRKLFADGPFTQDFSKEAPARLGAFIGLQIIRKYAENENEFSLQRLIETFDNQKILQISRYKPKKG